MLRLDPRDIVFDLADNTRHFGHSSEHIRILAESLIVNGQQQPVTIRRDGNNKPVLVSGYGRLQAALLINKDSDLRSLAQMEGQDIFRVNCLLVSANSEEAFLRSIVENKDRNPTTPIDDAHNIRRMIDQFGWDWDRVAEVFKAKFDKAWAQRLYNKILTLSDDIQRRVHEGKLSINIAMNLADMPESERAEAVQAAEEPDGHVDPGAVREAVRNSKQSRGRGLGRNVKEIRKVFEGIKDSEQHDDTDKRFAADMLRFIKGEIGEVGLYNAIRRLREAAPNTN